MAGGAPVAQLAVAHLTSLTRPAIHAPPPRAVCAATDARAVVAHVGVGEGGAGHAGLGAIAHGFLRVGDVILAFLTHEAAAAAHAVAIALAKAKANANAKANAKNVDGDGDRDVNGQHTARYQSHSLLMLLFFGAFFGQARRTHTSHIHRSTCPACNLAGICYLDNV